LAESVPVALFMQPHSVSVPRGTAAQVSQEHEYLFVERVSVIPRRHERLPSVTVRTQTEETP
jgi:hypothetical protein